MPPNEPLISVIVPHLNQPQGLEACLRSLDAQTLDQSQFEVVVVDNGSNAQPDVIVARHQRVRMLHERIPGPGQARNCGVQGAIGEILAFIDADCRAHPGWLQSALEAIHSMPDGSVLGGDVQIWHEGNASYTAIEAYESVFSYQFKRYIERHGFSGTGNMVVRRLDFEKVGLFTGISVAEDVEWGQRARAAGLIFRYVPNMIVFHPARLSLHELFVKWDRQIQHFLNMARGKPAWRIRWIARAVTVLASTLVELPRVATTDRLNGTPARMKALGVLVAVRTYRAWRMLSLLVSSKGVLWNRNAAVGLSDVE